MQNEQIIIRKMERPDIEWARALHNDPDVLKMLTDPKPVNKEEQEKWFNSMQESKKSERWVAEISGQKAGVIRIDEIDNDNNSVMVGLDLQKDFRGKGHAKNIYRLVLKHWFEEKKMNRVWLFVAEYNEIAINLYESLGFKKEGVARDALYRDGKYHGYIMMSMLKGEYNG